MKHIVVFGASGTFGRVFIPMITMNEHYHVTAVSRHASRVFSSSGNLAVADVDATLLGSVDELVKAADVVYCAVSGEDLPAVTQNIVTAMQTHGKKRLILMGAVGIYNEIPADMDEPDNVRNNPAQVPNRDAVAIVEQSPLDYTVLRPGYFVGGSGQDFTLTFKGEPAKGYKTTIQSVVGLACQLVANDGLHVGQSVCITKDMTKN